MAKKSKKEDALFETVASVIIFIGGLIMIILFIYLVGEKFNEIELMPGKVIYNNPGETDGYGNKDGDKPEIVEIEFTEEELNGMEDDDSGEGTASDSESGEDVQGAYTGWWAYPDEIYEIPIDQVRLDTVVDKGHKLKESYVPDDLVSDTANGIGGLIKVTRQTLDALNRLGEAAQKDGITNLTIVSSYRSYQTQATTYNYWLDYNGGAVDLVDQISARPGHSEHQLGTVVDFSTTETGRDFSAFQYTKAYQWIVENAGSFGFRQSYPEGMEEETGYAAEAWHWRY